VGIEPTHKGFADLSLTAWVPRQETQYTRTLAGNGLAHATPHLSGQSQSLASEQFVAHLESVI
jgi:hypothetical protein